MSSDFDTLAIFATMEAATSARIALDEAGIPALIDSNDASGALPNLQLVEGIRLSVPEDRFAEAREILGKREPITDDDDIAENALETIAAEAAAARPRPSPFHWVPVAVYSLGLLFAGLLTGFLLTAYGYLDGASSWFHSRFELGVRYDRNRDGKPDLVDYHGPDQKVLRVEEDNNFDGKADSWWYYRWGNLIRGEYDLDFDGVVDKWSEFEHGIFVGSGTDTDGDGKPDVFSLYAHGVLSEIDWKPGGKGLNRREVYAKGVLREVWVRGEGGEMVLRERLDPYGVPIAPAAP
jgi:hypothetical protein